MWEAYAAGTIPVGAVVADEAGAIVARGRNRIFDEPGDRQLGRTRLAHAEINALALLPPPQTYETFTLYSALEPCHLCAAAVYSARVGAARYAGEDPYAGGVGKLVPAVDHAAHPVVFEGPLPGPTRRLPELLHVAHMLWRVPDGSFVRFYREARPELAAAAAQMPPPDAGATLADAVAAVAP
jgi:tRNA(Arg) A34 adenosine deaminase TadA